MILCVRVGSLYNFKMLYENSELLQNSLEKVNFNTYDLDIESSDKVSNLLVSRKINHVIDLKD